MVAKKTTETIIGGELGEKSKKLLDVEHKQTEVLIDAIKKLADRFDMTKNRPQGETKSPGGFGTLKDMVKGKVDSVKQALTPEGLLDILAAKSGGGILGTVLGGASESIKEKKAISAKRVESKAKFAHGLLAGTEGGRNVVAEEGDEGAIKKASDLYDKNEKLQAKIDILEAKQRELKDSGITGADLDRYDAKELSDLKKEKESGVSKFGMKEKSPKKSREADPNPSAPAKTSREADPNPSAPAKTSLGQILYDTTVPLVDAHGDDMKNPEFAQGVRDGIEEELLTINKEQLEALNKIFNATQVTEEDKFEADNKDKKQDKKVEHKEKIKEQKPEGNGIMDLLKGGLKDKLLKKIPGLGRLGGLAAGMGGMGGMAMGALGVGSAGAAGVGAGMLMNKFILNPAAGAITGDKTDTVGTALHKAFGGDMDKKMKDADSKAEVELAKSKIAKGEMVSRALASKVAGQGVIVPPELIIQPKSQTAPYSHEMRKELNRTTTEIENLKSDVAKPADTKVMAPAVITNNNSRNMTIIRPDIRTREPTYNRILAGNVSY
jgi:hypothetical protein